MLDNFHIYVTTLNEECLIKYTLEALLNVFDNDQISVIDLGSKDNTLVNIPNFVHLIQENLPQDSAGKYFTDLKSFYSKKQEWVLWVDGDEIYPKFSLLKIKKWLEEAENNRHDKKALRLYWKILMNSSDGGLFGSKEYLSAGPKLFNSNFFTFKRAWPRELICSTGLDNSGIGEKKDFNGIWFWHGVLLRRSSIGATARLKKRQVKKSNYNKFLTWDKISNQSNNLSFLYDYSNCSTLWTVVNMSDRSGLDLRWSGKL